MGSMNSCFLIGNVAGNPDLKGYTRKDGTAGYRTWFRLAVCRNMDRGKKRDEQRTSFISVVCWGEAAKRHAEYIGKGDMIAVRGELVGETERLADGSYGREFVAIHANEIEYLRRADKNRSPEQLVAAAQRITATLQNLQNSYPQTVGTTGAAPTAIPSTGQGAFVSGPVNVGAVKIG